MNSGMRHIGQTLQEVNQRSTRNQRIYRDIEDSKEWSAEDKRQYWLLGNAGVTDLSNTFNNMRQPAGFEKTYNAFIELVSGKASWWMLMVYGGSGNGKTLCCEAAVIDLYDRGIRAKREKWADIIRFQLKAAFHNRQLGAESYEERFKRLRERSHLIIDDIGMGSTGGNWEWGELEDIIDYRLENKLFTILTTNLDVKAIPPRIVSRFRDTSRARIICNNAPDQRPLEVAP